jgi:hypothetical protein
MPMGWSHAVYVAHTTSLALADFRQEDFFILVYIDNIYIFGNDESTIGAATSRFLERSEQVGAKFEITTPVTSDLTILGIQCNLANKTFSLPESFTSKFRAVMKISLCFSRTAPLPWDLRSLITDYFGNSLVL